MITCIGLGKQGMGIRLVPDVEGPFRGNDKKKLKIINNSPHLNSTPSPFSLIPPSHNPTHISAYSSPVNISQIDAHKTEFRQGVSEMQYGNRIRCQFIHIARVQRQIHHHTDVLEKKE